MTTPFPIPAHFLLPAPGLIDAWRALQAALGGRHARFLVASPNARGQIPSVAPEQDCPAALSPGVVSAMTHLMSVAGPAICDLCHDWDLAENPYALLHAYPGGLLFHEDPLSWVIDAQSEALRAGEAPEDAPVALLLPGDGEGGHAAMTVTAAFETMPASLHAFLDEAAHVDGHGDLCPLTWHPADIPDPQ